VRAGSVVPAAGAAGAAEGAVAEEAPAVPVTGEVARPVRQDTAPVVAAAGTATGSPVAVPLAGAAVGGLALLLVRRLRGRASTRGA
jgi:hypothetical protein